MSKLRFATPDAWAEAVMQDLDSFLIDHAAAEKKAAGMANSMLSHYPDKIELVNAMIDLSIEEMVHFKQVVKIMHERGLTLQADSKDAYVNEFRKSIRKGSDAYFLDRLLLGSVIEARGCERFGLVAEALPEGSLKKFYRNIAASEAKHDSLFEDLACLYFPQDSVASRLDELLDIEAAIVEKLPIRSALH
ncbi:MAG: tRNA-(ms[2]io[6]A)-hydroxylase [Cellvibrionaceae bacterium]|nr:tRNA-(ms[2]io[6]A)-hydroxylase [Cellvibrionaceae bacterium]